MTQFVSAEEALKIVKSNDNVFIHTAAATPQQLVRQLTLRAEELMGVKVYSIHTEGDCSYADPKYEKSFEIHSFFNGGNLRKVRGNLNPSFVPIFLSEIPTLFYNQTVPLDVALIQVSPPDQHGMCSLGPSVDVSIAAVRSAKTVIAQVNPRMPRTFGDSQFEFSKVHYAVEVNEELYIKKATELTETELQIGRNVASLIEDGATLQMGIGAIPDATLKALTGHRDLGVHTEMFSDGLVELYKTGAITNKFKKRMRDKIVTSFAIGSRKTYDFIDNNPMVVMMDATYTNDTHIIRQNPKVIAINSAIEVDLTGQVCADSIGARIYSGVGGQMDFMRGAALSPGGKPIIALPSKTAKGESKISAFLKEGAGVTTTRAHVHYIVTEYGVAYLHGKTLKERTQALIAIAAPEFRETLEIQAKKVLGY
ncbi:MAG: 4-hydroxybutyrate CoA-transferase [Bdellovibrio sp. ArHS]|uniref:acetyl-CoA hydrolase/transferase family protein n=1 Tax=Bdellovibrio sp. ArHS TaxID=1569284 RepID=UPI0005829E77|nr:acetyl-CoA hydrolase/transferase C-terminal domain-containing protein [Bdellovibrio sp. ArHS]KHD89466.1 MAG: 4-hydroxybutyrate CoA-transferase [Bdellovibrio sp. ArHS]